MSTIRDWVIQVRYPYTAGVITVIWSGTALFAVIVPKAHVEVLVVCVALTTLLIARIGFSTGSR